MPSTNGHGLASGAGRIALYLRVSSEEQRDRETIEIQRDFLVEYCHLYGLEIAGVYADDGVPGTIPCTNGRMVGGSWRTPEKACLPRSWSTAWTGWGGRCWSSWTPTTASRPPAYPCVPPWSP